MFKNIFKSAKNLVKESCRTIRYKFISWYACSKLRYLSPALLAGGIGLLGGAKPEDVLRGVALGAQPQH